jgi:hypothetical protein
MRKSLTANDEMFNAATKREGRETEKSLQGSSLQGSSDHEKKIQTSSDLEKKIQTGEILAFLYRCLRPKYSYWSTMISMRKFSLTLLVVGVQFVGLRVKIALLILLLIFFTELNSLNQPYQFKVLNRLETASLYLSLFSANFGLMMMAEELRNHAFVIQIVMVLFNGFFCMYAILCLMITFYDKGTFITKILHFFLRKRDIKSSRIYRMCSVGKQL